ncbi:MAG: hypothetical protein WBQ23_04260 [Bacteroidota bacterium]
MAFQDCTRVKTTKVFVRSGYEQLPDKTIVVWPPECAVDTKEHRIETYKRLKEEYGLCVLHIYMTEDTYTDALEAGWDNSQIRLAFERTFMDSIEMLSWPPPPDFPVENWQNYSGPTPPTVLQLLTSGLIDLDTAVDYAFRIKLGRLSDRHKSIKPGVAIEPFYSLYIDEPKFLVDSPTNLLSYAGAELAGLFPDYQLDSTNDLPLLTSISGYIRTQRNSGNPWFYSRNGRVTLFNIGTYFQEYPVFQDDKRIEIIGRLADRVYFTQYHNRVLDYASGLFGLFGDDYWDQREEWESLNNLVPDASAYISLEEDWGSKEPSVLFDKANDLHWDTLAIFGGSQNMPCDVFWKRLDGFCHVANARGWMKIKGYYSYVGTLEYCMKPNCDCSESEWTSDPSNSPLWSGGMFGWE